VSGVDAHLQPRWNEPSRQLQASNGPVPSGFDIGPEPPCCRGGNGLAVCGDGVRFRRCSRYRALFGTECYGRAWCFHCHGRALLGTGVEHGWREALAAAEDAPLGAECAGAVARPVHRTLADHGDCAAARSPSRLLRQSFPASLPMYTWGVSDALPAARGDGAFAGYEAAVVGYRSGGGIL
jgi:hypothetical protein